MMMFAPCRPSSRRIVGRFAPGIGRTRRKADDEAVSMGGVCGWIIINYWAVGSSWC